ncbi:MAG: DUF4249 family protein [Bacteroidales bacterium]|nr:DUF4249 family protein [Bacteroidales bacterium]
MATKFIIRTAALAATLLAAASCIFPYEVDIKKASEWPLVVEGDILVGGVTTVKFSYVQPFDTDSYDDYQSTPPRVTGYIEGEDGSRVEGAGPWSSLDWSDGLLYFDTGSLREGQRYRLHFETLDKFGDITNTFESDWLEPCPAPTIDALSYSKNEGFDELWIGLTMHCHGSHHFRWSFSEVWEYHSDLNTMLRYDPPTKTIGYYSAYDEPNLYYCWKSANSSKINIFSTANQTEDRFEELAFHTIPLSDQRLQVMYKITVQLQAMSEDAFNYWNNMQQNSEGQGSIFSPTPSEMASNVRCISDPDLQVMGYVNAAVPVEAVMFYDNGENKFYKPGPARFRDEKKVNASYPDSLAYWYHHGYLPYDELYETMSPTPSHYMWALNACIDCRRLGGTKTKPEGWPSGHN